MFKRYFSFVAVKERQGYTSKSLCYEFSTKGTG